MSTQVGSTACVFSCNHDNKSMANRDALPTDVEACHAFIEQVNDVNRSLATQLQNTKHELEQLKRYIYGQRSERHAEGDSQLTLFGEEQDSAPENVPEDDEVLEEEITYRRRKRTKADRFPENLPREIQAIDVPEEERQCPCCGDEMPVIDTDIRERLEFIPAKFLVHELHYHKRACGKCKETVAVSPPPPATTRPLR